MLAFALSDQTPLLYVLPTVATFNVTICPEAPAMTISWLDILSIKVNGASNVMLETEFAKVIVYFPSAPNKLPTPMSSCKYIHASFREICPSKKFTVLLEVVTCKLGTSKLVNV